MFIVFTFNTKVETWYCNVKKRLVKFRVVEFIQYTVSKVEFT